MKELLVAHGITKRFGETVALQSIDLSVHQGEVVAVIGPSGSGKTTLIRCLGLLEPVDAGTISVAGRPGVVFQEFHLWPHKDVLGNLIEGPILVKRIRKHQAIEKAKHVLEQVGLLDKAGAFPASLSGGQKQRVAIARALMMEPQVLLLDEITSALDPELVGTILKTIKRLAAAGTTMVVVTHHMQFAREIADKVVILDEGKAIEQGSPETIFESPRQARTKRFLQSVIEDKQQITVYEGYEDFQSYHIGLLKRMHQGATGYAVGTIGDTWFETMDDAYKEYESIFLRKKFTWKWISYQPLESFEQEVKKRLKSRLQVSVVSAKLATPANYNVWGDTVILQVFGDPPTVIEIRNPKLAQGYLNYFELLWKQGKKI